VHSYAATPSLLLAAWVVIPAHPRRRGSPRPVYDRRVSMSRRSSDLVVVSPLKDWICAACGSADEGLLAMEDRGPVCMSCADLGHLVFLPRGDTALTRRARKHSRLSAVVVRFSRSRRRHERQGVLVEEAAIARAEAECLADEDARAGSANARRKGERAKTSPSSASSQARSRTSSPHARGSDARRSQHIPRNGAAAGSAAPPAHVHSTRRRSRSPSSRRFATATPTTTMC
jgi:hypothetical protein